MSAAAFELQKAIFARLTQSETLSALMNGVRLYDQAPANAVFPYLTFGRTSAYDWSTDTESGSEHLVTIHVWSKERGKSQCHAVIEAVRGELDDAALMLGGHALVRIGAEFVEVRYEDEHDVHHGLARFRALIDAA
ncbi:DUF3168 domain-containing protein [Aliihoeflea sp. PC F10.4]